MHKENIKGRDSQSKQNAKSQQKESKKYASNNKKGHTNTKKYSKPNTSKKEKVLLDSKEDMQDSITWDNCDIELDEISDENDNMKLFRELGLKDKVLKGIKEAGFSVPSPIQQKAIPPILERRDIIAQAQTGTGKTAAFALPILNGLKNNKTIEALIITPTRELAMQISDEVFKLGKFLKIRTICVYGGQSIKKQVELIEKKPQVMIATPGRLLDHLSNGRLKNFFPSVVVLDESDEMLDMGFIDDIEEIFKYIPNTAQTLLFSATMPDRIRQLADRILYDPVNVKVKQADVTNNDISQRYYIINENERNDAILRLIDTESPTKSIIFIRTKKEAEELNNFLKNKGHKSATLHGDMDQRMRREAITAFRNNKADILVATDVAARGLDISDISHVFNYHIPMNIESYVHRIGRTGRAGRSGIAITLATPLEYRDLKKIQTETNSNLELYEIPTISNDEVINNILKAKVKDEAISLYENVKDKIDIAQLSLKLLSLHLDNQVRIGLSKQEVQNNIHNDSESISTEKRGRHSSRSNSRNSSRNALGKSDKRGRGNRANEAKLKSQQKYYRD